MYAAGRLVTEARTAEATGEQEHDEDPHHRTIKLSSERTRVAS
jgi:hypothetical protein